MSEMDSNYEHFISRSFIKLLSFVGMTLEGARVAEVALCPWAKDLH